MSQRHFPFVVLEIEVDDLGRASSFYSAIFGWTFAESVAEHGALEAEILEDHDTMVRVHLRARDAVASPTSENEGSAHRYRHSLCVRDLEPILERVEEAGGRLISGPVDVPGLGRRLYIHDTEGNEVAILEPMHAS